MRFGIHTLEDFPLRGRTVLCRVDINQAVDRASDTLKSIQRIAACVPTVRELSEKGARTVLLAHQGSDIEYKNFYCTRPHARVLSEILLMDNVRFCSEEQTLFEMKLRLSHEQQTRTQVVEKLAPLADLYVCDAFAAAHRDQPSLCGFEYVLPSAMGRLFERDYCVISELMEAPKHPCTFALGGSKISDAFLMMETVLKNGVADRVLTGGLVGEILLAARGVEIGRGTLNCILQSNYSGYLAKARPIDERSGERIALPVDLAQVRDGVREEAKIGEIPEDFNAVDIGSATAKRYAEIILASRTVFANGPMGVFEEAQSEHGTRAMFEALAQTRAYTVVGGGDSVTAANKYRAAERLDYLCTGGGALIRFLTGEELPVVRALRNGARKFPAQATV